MKDTENIDTVIKTLYSIISGPIGEERDWERFRSLFIPGARLIRKRRIQGGPIQTLSQNVEEYIKSAQEFFRLQGFYESEIARRTEEFGSIAHVFSTYESKLDKNDPKPFSRGINSIQLLGDNDRWWVVNLLWESESEMNPIPEKYLP